MLLVDLLVVHREAHEISTKEAAIESAVWISIGVAFTGVIVWWFGAPASGEYISGYLIEKSLSIDNVFVWALIMSYFLVPLKYQHRVLFWGIFGALVLRAIFIFAGVALIEKFDWVLYVFGAFLLYTAAKLIFGNDEEVDPRDSKFLKLVNRFVPSTDEYDGQKLFTDQERQAAGDAAVRRAGAHRGDRRRSSPSTRCRPCSPSATSSSSCSRRTRSPSSGCGPCTSCWPTCTPGSRYLQQGLAVILAFVGIKMLIAEWYHIPTAPRWRSSPSSWPRRSSSRCR